MPHSFYWIILLSFIPYGIFFTLIFIDAILGKNKPPMNSSQTELTAPVSIILTCFNEEKYIEEKLASLLDKSNWIDGSEVIIVTGGSTDSTNKILEQFRNHASIKLIIKENRISKIQGVNLAVTKSKNALLVFSDFRQQMAPGSIQQLIKNFRDPLVGTVSGTLIDSKNAKPSFVRSLMNSAAIHSSKSASSLNVFGALYAQRKKCFRSIPENILFDDLFVTVSTLAQKKRLVQEKDAAIYDVNFYDYYGKDRIKRLARGLILFLFHHHALIQQMPFGIRIKFLLFKYLKLVFPLCSFLITLSMLALISAGHYSIPMFIIIATIIILAIPRSRYPFLRFLQIHYYFATAIILFIVGNERSVYWNKLPTNK